MTAAPDLALLERTYGVSRGGLLPAHPIRGAGQIAAFVLTTLLIKEAMAFGVQEGRRIDQDGLLGDFACREAYFSSLRQWVPLADLEDRHLAEAARLRALILRWEQFGWEQHLSRAAR